MLSPHDRRLLADIERRLSAEQADLAQLLEGFDRWAPPRRRLRRRVLLVVPVLGAALLAGAFAAHSAAMLLLAASAALFEAFLLVVFAVVRAHHRHPGQGAPGPGSADSGRHLTR